MPARLAAGLILLLTVHGVAWAQGQVRMDPRLSTLLAKAMAQSGEIWWKMTATPAGARVV